MSDLCVVCRNACGNLKGQAKSWRCAGVLSHRKKRSRQLRNTLRDVYGNEAKAEARATMLPDLVELPTGARVLDLYGGGLSAEWITAARPDIQLTVAEQDERLWPALDEDASRLGFVPVLGDFSLAAGPFDLVFLDLCSEPFGAYEHAKNAVQLLACRPKFRSLLSPRDTTRSALYVTVLHQNRKGYSELTHVHARAVAIKALLAEAACVLPDDVRLVSEYRSAGGKGMVGLWSVGATYVDQAQSQSGSIFTCFSDHRDMVNRFYAQQWQQKSTGAVGPRDGASHAMGVCPCEEWRVSSGEKRCDRAAYQRWLVTGRPEFPTVQMQEEAA